jgi:threonine/homoserine/homoserine lactone efflux protein
MERVMGKFTERLMAVSACFGAVCFMAGRFVEGGDDFNQIMRILTALAFIGFGIKIALKGVE